MRQAFLALVLLVSGSSAWADVGDGEVFRADCSIHVIEGDVLEGALPRTIAEFQLDLPYGQRKVIYRDTEGSFELIFGDSMHVIEQDGTEKYHMQFILLYRNAVNGELIRTSMGFHRIPEGISLSPGEKRTSLLCNVRE